MFVSVDQVSERPKKMAVARSRNADLQWVVDVSLPCNVSSYQHQRSQEMKLQSSAMRLMSLVVIIVGAALQLGACSSKQDDVLGKWESDDQKTKVEFFEDKTLTLSDKHGMGGDLSGKWILLTDGRIKVDLVFAGMPGPPSMGALKGGKLALSEGIFEKQELVLKKVGK